MSYKIKKRKQKVYELTTNAKGGYQKYLVKGIKNEEEAKKVAKQGFGKSYYEPKLISYYDTNPSPYGNNYSKTPTKKQFIKEAKEIYR